MFAHHQQRNESRQRWVRSKGYSSGWKLTLTLVIAVTVTVSCTPLAYASTAGGDAPYATGPLINKHEANLVSLGDSITFGEHLPGSKLPRKAGVQGTPSPDAFPYLVARDEKWKVKDLGMAGYTSGHLLKWMKQKKIQNQIANADIVTLDIGSNDLLHAAYGALEQVLGDPASVTPTSQQKMFKQALSGFQKNLRDIVNSVHQETSAPIIMMTLYDPFPDNTTLHEIAEPLLAKANQIIVQTAISQHCWLMNTYSLMNHQQKTLIRSKKKDIHPSITGQQAIAAAVEKVIRNPANYQPEKYAVVTIQTNVHKAASVFSQTTDTLAVGDVVQVVGEKTHWLEILHNGSTGYISPSDVQVVNRPWPIIEAPSQQKDQPVKLGWLSAGTQTEPVLAVLWNGTVYSPMQSLIQSIGATETTDQNTDVISIQTMQSSGLPGWWKQHQIPAPNPYFWPPFNLTAKPLTKAQQYGLSFHETSGQPMQLNLQTTAQLVQIDGEPIRFKSPVIQIGGDLYLPAETFWKAVGGQT